MRMMQPTTAFAKSMTTAKTPVYSSTQGAYTRGKQMEPSTSICTEMRVEMSQSMNALVYVDTRCTTACTVSKWSGRVVRSGVRSGGNACALDGNEVMIERVIPGIEA